MWSKENQENALPWKPKVCLVKAVVFPAVIYGCESWTIKKTECWRTDAFELWYWRRLLRDPWIARRPNQSTLKEINPEYSLEGLMLKLQYFGHLMWKVNSRKDAESGNDWRQKEKRGGGQRVRWLDSIINSVDMNLSKFWEIVDDRAIWCGAVHGVAKIWMWL